MTCIVGLARGGKVFMGGDSAGVSGFDMSIRADQKVFIRDTVNTGEMVFGFAGSFRMGQLLRYSLEIPPFSAGDDVHRYLATTFVDALRTCLKGGGFARKENEVELGGTFLLGFRGRLFQIESDFQVGERTEGFDAIGCGDGYALGVLHALHESAPPRISIERALVAAAHFSAGVRAPFVFAKGGAA